MAHLSPFNQAVAIFSLLVENRSTHRSNHKKQSFISMRTVGEGAQLPEVRRENVTDTKTIDDRPVYTVGTRQQQDN